MRVARMMVVCFHPDVGDAPFVDEVPALPSEVEAMMSEQRRRHLTVGNLLATSQIGTACQRIVVRGVSSLGLLEGARRGFAIPCDQENLPRDASQRRQASIGFG